MKNWCVNLSLVRSVFEHDGYRWRGRVDRHPVVEEMEPRALLSTLAPHGTTVVPPAHSGGALVVPINQAPSFHAVYQTSHLAAASGLTGPSSVDGAATAQIGSVTTPAVTADDDTGGDDGDGGADGGGDGDGGDDGDGDGGDGDGDGDGDDNNGDEVDDENDP